MHSMRMCLCTASASPHAPDDNPNNRLYAFLLLFGHPCVHMFVLMCPEMFVPCGYPNTQFVYSASSVCAHASLCIVADRMLCVETSRMKCNRFQSIHRVYTENWPRSVLVPVPSRLFSPEHPDLQNHIIRCPNNKDPCHFASL